MKLTTVTNVSLDGVMQGHRRIDAGTRREARAPDEDGSSRFERFGWAPPLLDDEASTSSARLSSAPTRSCSAGGPTRSSPAPGERAWIRETPVGEALNTRPKYVASTTLTDPQWPGTTVLSGDVAAAIGELRAEPGGELQVWGSGTLIRWLLEHWLVDEMVLLTYPVVIGQRRRLFSATGPDIGLELVDLRSTPRGLTIQTYRTTGRPQYETATA